ncbi:MAG: SH3 domain-containing protein [Chloroflexaceae bacterium]|nr:SH3 domain-containing protein [Chloroflexaceae bacterium]NJO07202.1 SH3 domain-containing protein [Chloroflexaceae bacterium]
MKRELEEARAQIAALQTEAEDLRKRGGETAVEEHVTYAAEATTDVGLAAGATAYVRQEGGKNLNRRDNPGIGTNVLDSLPPGTALTLLEGPVPADNYTWWRIRTNDGREGWVAGEELVTQPE